MEFTWNILGRGLVKLLMISSLSHSVISQEPYPDFFWENEYLVKPVPYFQGAELKMPVIEGEVVKIKCKVRLGVNVTYNIRWRYSDFDGNNTPTTITGNGGAELAVSTVTLNIDKPAKIDEKTIGCMKKNSDTIDLQFIVYVKDSNVPCGPCYGKEPIKLKRWANKKTLDQSLQKAYAEKLKEKLKQKREYAESEVYVEDDYICGCKTTTTTTTTTATTKRTATTATITVGQKAEQNSSSETVGIVGGIFGSLAIVALAARIGYIKRHHIEEWWKKTFNRQNDNDATVEGESPFISPHNEMRTLDCRR